jgi:hypothetical protein
MDEKSIQTFTLFRSRERNSEKKKRREEIYLKIDI